MPVQKKLNTHFQALFNNDVEIGNVFPEENILIDSRLGYFIRPGRHSMTVVDWNAWLDFCDIHLGK